MAQSGRRWKFGWCEYVEISRTLFVRGERSALRGKPLDVLVQLLKDPESVVPNETLLQTVWGNTSRQSLSVAISKLRKAFGGELDEVIQNVSSEGYRMAVPVVCEVAEEVDPPALVLAVGDPIPGQPNWTAEERLGGPEGGPVWLGRNSVTGERRVYKFATDGVRLRALQREKTVAGILRMAESASDSLLHIYDWDFRAKPYYLESEYVGPSLLRFAETAEFQALSRQERVSLIAMLADTAAAAHAVGVLHNDLKPSNVLVRRLRRAGSHEQNALHARYAMVLVDFGDSTLLHGESAPHGAQVRAAAKQEDEDLFQVPVGSSATIGSEMYRAPELRSGGSGTVEADVYSLGVILYQAVVGDFGHAPSAGWQQEVVDPLLEEDISRAANRKPGKRFRTAAALAEQLHSLEQRRLEQAAREQSRRHTLQVQRDLDRARAARPWVLAAVIALTAGLVVSGLAFRTAIRERNIARRENLSLEAMLRFLSEDVLDQSNPAAGVPGSARAIDLTLAGAIRNAVPQIDRRFPNDPVIAGKLHETIADGLRARSQYVEADQQYATAAVEYRAAEGALSQEAIAVELKREATQITGLTPGAMARARTSFDQQVNLIHQVQHPAPQVVVLEEFVESGLLGLEADPAKAIPPLERAIALAEATPGFDPMLLLWIKGRYCGLYVRLQDGARLQAAAEERIRDISGRFGKDSPMLTSYEIYLQEAYYLQGEYEKAIQQADRNFPRFQRLLGDHHQYTLAVLANRAASLAQLGRYAEASQNDLRLYAMEGADPSGFRLKEGSLNDAALFACRSGQFRDGTENARKVSFDTGPGPNSMPEFYGGSKFILAECLVGEQEASGHPSPDALANAESLLKQVDTAVIAQRTGDTGYAAFVELTAARIALLRHDFARAKQDLPKLDRFFAEPHSDPYELQQYRRLKDRCSHGNDSHTRTTPAQ